MSIRRAPIALLTILGLGVGLAACSSSPSASKVTKPPHVTTPNTTLPQTTLPSTTTAPSTTSPAVTTPAASSCQNSQLKVTESSGGAAAGTIQIPFTIANTGSTACALNGYPALTLVPKSGTVNPKISHSGQGQVFAAGPSTITLPANGSNGAAFVMSYSDVQSNGQSSCPEITEIKAALPGPAGTFEFAQRFYPCGAPNIGVSAIVSYATYKSQFG